MADAVMPEVNAALGAGAETPAPVGAEA
jgi:hypothetical protein